MTTEKMIRRNKMAYGNLFIIPVPKKVTRYEENILAGMLKGKGRIVAGHRCKTMAKLGGQYEEIRQHLRYVEGEHLILFFSNIPLNEAQDALDKFTGGSFPKPGCLATQTIVLREDRVPRLAGIQPSLMAQELRELGVAAHSSKGKVFLSEPHTVFKHGDVLTWKECEVARLLQVRMPEYKLRISHMWSKSMGFRILHPKRRSLLNRVFRPRKRSISKVTQYDTEKLEEEFIVWKSKVQPFTGWQSMRPPVGNGNARVVTIKEEPDEKKIKQEPIKSEIKEEPLEISVKQERAEKEGTNEHTAQEINDTIEIK